MSQGGAVCGQLTGSGEDKEVATPVNGIWQRRGWLGSQLKGHNAIEGSQLTGPGKAKENG